MDAHIIATNGFRIFRDKAMKDMITALCKKTGIIILTDSDRAGFVIRNHIKSFCHEGEILNLYIPDVKGKEKRKEEPSKEGLLGVEGMEDEVLIKLLSEADVKQEKKSEVSYYEFYTDGFAGGMGSSALREKFLKEVNLPKRLLTRNCVPYYHR